MPQILLRGGKSPFARVSYEDTLARNTLGTNSGNLIFADATWRILATKDTTITMSGYRVPHMTADEINQTYDALVLPFANAFRISFMPQLRRFTDLINRLDIPVIVAGIGAQAPIGADASAMAAMNTDVRDFCRAVLQRSASIGVRGAYTYDLLRGLGFDDSQVEIIGCPAMFYHGPDLPQITPKQTLDADDLVSMNLSPYVKGIAEVFEHNYAHYPRMIYIPQNNESLDQILWDGKTLATNGKVYPKTTSHPVFTDNRMRFFIDSQPWLDHLSGYDFVFGTRIHGNIMALLAGTPAFVIAHDSRTLELAQYFEIPHIPMSQITPTTLAADLFAQADYGPLQRGHAARFATWIRFLEKNGLHHVYAPGEDRGAAFDAQRAATMYPPMMPPLPHQTPDHLRARAAWRRRQIPRRLLSRARHILFPRKGQTP